MDNYDRTTDTGYSHGGGGGNDLGSCGSCSKTMIFWSNLILSVLAIALIVVGVYAYLNESSSQIGALSQPVLILIIICGVLIMLVSVVGCCGATSESPCLVITYITLLIIIILMEISIAGLVFNSKYLEEYSRKTWKSSSDNDRDRYQNKFDCCGFDDYLDNPGPNCQVSDIVVETTDVIEDGCYDSIKKEIEGYRIAIGIFSILLMTYQIAMLTFSCCLCNRLRSRESRLQKV